MLELAYLSLLARLVRMVCGASISLVAFAAILVMGVVLTHPPSSGAARLDAPAVAGLRAGANLAGRICSVFGDVVAGAQVRLGAEEATTDLHGRFDLHTLPPGLYTVRVSAHGFEPLERSVQVNDGDNSVLFKYESGLWPDRFAADFHVFYAMEDGDQKLFVALAIANPETTPIELESLRITGPYGRVVADLLPDAPAFEQFVSVNVGTQLITEPSYAVQLPGRSVIPIDVPPLRRPAPPPEEAPASASEFHLTIHYRAGGPASAPEAQLEIAAAPHYEPDWDPHTD